MNIVFHFLHILVEIVDLNSLVIFVTDLKDTLCHFLLAVRTLLLVREETPSVIAVHKVGFSPMDSFPLDYSIHLIILVYYNSHRVSANRNNSPWFRTWRPN